MAIGVSEPDATYVRVAINITTGSVCLLLCVALFRLVFDANITQRWLHGYMLAAIFGEFCLHAWVAWRWATNSAGHLPLWAAVLQNSTLSVFALYFYATRVDIQSIYRRPDPEHLANLHLIEQNLQRAVLQKYKVTKVNPELSPELVNHGDRGA